MMQHLKNPSGMGATVVPACEVCGHTTRLVGIEPSPARRGEIATFQCTSCANVQAHARPRVLAG